LSIEFPVLREKEREIRKQYVKNRTMKSLTRTASILHKILRDHEIKEDVSVKAHRKNE